jgi:biopolymer transport protein ExbD
MSERDKASARQCGGLNTTPMIDVVFLLLIFFIVSTEFRSTEGLLPSNLPGTAGPGEWVDPPVDEVRIILSQDPNAVGRSFTARIYSDKLGGEARGPEQVTAALRGRAAAFGGQQYREKALVIIQPDSGVEYNDVVLVLDAVVAARMKNVTFAMAGA